MNACHAVGGVGETSMKPWDTVYELWEALSKRKLPPARIAEMAKHL